MKYFTLAAAVIGAISATSEEDKYLERDQAFLDQLKAKDNTCYGSGYNTFLDQLKENNTPMTNATFDNYVVRTKTINNGGSRFMTISCKAPSWQDNGNVHDPYGAKKWNRTLAAKYTQFRDDQIAYNRWIDSEDAGKNGNWPQGNGGRYRCANYNGTRKWHTIRDLHWECPDHDVVGAWKKFVPTALHSAAFSNNVYYAGGHPDNAIDGLKRNFKIGDSGVQASSTNTDAYFTANLKESCVVSRILAYPATRDTSLNSDTFRRWEVMEVFVDNQACSPGPNNTLTIPYIQEQFGAGKPLEWVCPYTTESDVVKFHNDSWYLEISELEVYC